MSTPVGKTSDNDEAAAQDNSQIVEKGNHHEDLGAAGGEKKWPGWPGDTVYRILVPWQKVGGLIGRKGEFIKKMCEESRARIKVLDGPPGAPVRAVLPSDLRQQVNHRVTRRGNKDPDCRCSVCKQYISWTFDLKRHFWVICNEEAPRSFW